uniref:DUF3453 domain-containing protein n=1 Tax=Elaeophora elaphi TaxID=1147741 RepID=A0A0R3RJS7_9BILA
MKILYAIEVFLFPIFSKLLDILVERSSVLLQLANASPVSSNKVIQTSLSCCVAHLIASVDDPNVAVAQQALLAIQHMPSASLKLMCLCLESQFDSSILDRALIITRIQQLTSILPDEEILTWEFFIQRFEVLAIEGQLLVKNGESNFIHDLTHSDPLSELYQRKVTRARQTIENSPSARSIVRTLQNNSMWHQLNAATFRPSCNIVGELKSGEMKRRTNALTSGRKKIRRLVTIIKVISAWKFSKHLQSFTNAISTLARSTNRMSSPISSISSSVISYPYHYQSFPRMHHTYVMNDASLYFI